MQAPNSTAAHFRSLHDPAQPLALSNAWDVASAIVAERAGARAVATTSAGIAWSLGSQDGDKLDRDRAIAAIASIAAAVSVPVTADIEGGFAEAPGGIDRSITAVIEAGAVGVNIEDGTVPPDIFAERIAAARAAADRAGSELFINARTDVFWQTSSQPGAQAGSKQAGNQEGERLEAALERAAAYLAAGADGIFVPGASSPATVAALVAGIAAPVNILVGPGRPTVGALRELGVARVSLGSEVVRAAYAVAQRATQELLTEGTYGSLDGAFAYGELNGMLAPRSAE